MRDTNAEVSFINNDTAMMIGGRWWTLHFKNLSHVNWRVAPLGRSFRGRHLCVMGGNTFAISAQTKYPDIAFQLLLFLTTPEQIKHLVDNGRLDPDPPRAGGERVFPQRSHAPERRERRLLRRHGRRGG